MTITPAYRTLLRLYPADYKARFAAEMLLTFEEPNGKLLSQSSIRYLHFAVAELLGLLVGITTEWMAKLFTDVSARGRNLPDLRMMRPPGLTREVWFAQAGLTASQKFPTKSSLE